MNNIHDPLRPSVQNHHIHTNDSSPIDAGKAWQSAFQFLRERRESLLQTGRQSAVAFQMLLEARREIPPPFGQPGRQV